ncbi:MAG: hypothetical protein IKH07_02290 [Oscillospiraceae bacterium]|nr:hypothetical protein [Oscillospiraceae bacterium]
MKSHVLYEAAFSFDYFWLILLILPVGIAFVTFRQFRKAKQTGKTGDKLGLGMGVFALLVVLVVIGIVVPDQIKMYDAAVGAYKRGEYEIVEGYVENFDTDPKRWEDFTVGNVHFSYGYQEMRFGYHNIRQKGGVITGNGQHLKIGYTNYGNYGNVIVYIEELP